MVDRKDRIRVQIAGKEYNVVGGDFQAMLAAVKQINGRRFDGQAKVWQLPGTVQQIQTQLDISGFQIEGGASVAAPSSAAAVAPAAAADRIKILVQGRPLAVVGGAFQEMLAVVKNLPGRRFNADSKAWEVPGEAAIINQLVEAAGFKLEGLDKPSAGTTPRPEAPDFGFVAEPPPYEEPDFLWNEAEVPVYEPPGWWDEEAAPPPVDLPLDDWSASEPAPTARAAAGNSARRSEQVRVRVGGIPFVVSGGEFQAMLAAIKQLPGRRFDGQDKVWDIPAEAGLDAVRQRLEAAGFQLSRD